MIRADRVPASDHCTGSASGTLLAMPFEIIGPFRKHYVQVNGHQVPHLEAWREAATPGKVWLSVGNRMLDIPEEEADRAIEFLADAIAWAMGYTCHPRADMEEPIRRTPFPKWTAITSVTTDTDILTALDPDNGGSEDG